MAPQRQHATPTSIHKYDGRRLDDAELAVLGPAVASFAKRVPANQPTAEELRRLQPDASEPGEDEASELAKYGPSTVTCHGRGYISIALWLADAVIVVRCKQLVMDAILDCWVERVFAETQAPIAADRFVGKRAFPAKATRQKRRAS